MEPTMIAKLKPGDGDEPVEIKVIRKWISFGPKSECCFIFVDKKGDAIQAAAPLSDKGYFDSLLKLDTCYSLTNYICENGKTFMLSVLPHKAGIRLGKATKFQQIAGDGFPAYYFNFLDYERLSSKIDNHRILTDFIGRFEYVTDILKVKGSTLIRVKLESLSGKMIEATFWDDEARSFNKEVVTSLPSPVIIAVTSMKVSQYLGRLQLTATPASHIYINPEIDVTKSLTSHFIIEHDANPVLKIEYEKSKNVDIEMNRNRFTLAQLLSQNPSRYMGVQFTCRSSLTSLDEGKEWYYKACDKCRKKLQPRGKTLACTDHEVIEPKTMYFICGNVSDETAEAKATFFDDSATTLLKTDSITMIDKLGYSDPNVLPVLLIELKGKTKIFQLHFSPTSKLGVVDFVIDHVFTDILVAENNAQTLQQIDESASYKSVLSATPAPATPSPATPSPATSSVSPISSSQCMETKRPASSAKKELFRVLPVEGGKEHTKKQKRPTNESVSKDAGPQQ